MLQHVYKDSVKFGTPLMLICGKLDDRQETVPIKNEAFVVTTETSSRLSLSCLWIDFVALLLMPNALHTSAIEVHYNIIRSRFHPVTCQCHLE